MIQQRKTGNRTENPSSPESTSVLISWIHYKGNDKKNGQLISEWEKDGSLLMSLFKVIDTIQSSKLQELINKGFINLYGKFPENRKTDFSCPPDLNMTDNWGVIKKIHQHSRVAGFFKNGYFYIVFLDREHKFYKSSRFHKC
ncbi:MULTISPECIES: hypothetical protein [Neisseria]|jgi:hypothetical protein|uniref:Uncharacterized protein n=2 Tax=Neisseria TaxID=482 RepID=A0ABD7EVZ1_NEIPE|nr:MULTISPECIES: hypothetical protein [Neisseria]OFM28444.1 hypothetical protein HMPREF2700_05585 [Neisseria sp. HMSC068C04]QXW89904.1 hypothetical protein LPB400_07770 [Neisseria perflava]QXW94821.1 hypothetical protein LPB402_00340 [Neisseria sicca ATCC 29256]